MDHKEQLKSMLQSVINGKEEEAAATMHDYFVSKTRQVAGFASAEMPEDDLDIDAELAALGELENSKE